MHEKRRTPTGKEPIIRRNAKGQEMKVVPSIGSKPRPRTSDKERARLAKERERESR